MDPLDSSSCWLSVAGPLEYLNSRFGAPDVVADFLIPALAVGGEVVVVSGAAAGEACEESFSILVVCSFVSDQGLKGLLLFPRPDNSASFIIGAYDCTLFIGCRFYWSDAGSSATTFALFTTFLAAAFLGALVTFFLAGAFLAAFLAGFFAFADAFGAAFDSPKSFGLCKKAPILAMRAAFSPDRSKFKNTHSALRSSTDCRSNRSFRS